MAAAVLLPALYLVRRRYRTWIEGAIRAAFERVDSDHSGSVDSEELYSCVLAIYLELNMYGLYVIPPDRESVHEIEMETHGGKGELDFAEFSTAIRKITAGAFTRCITTVFLTFLCPALATQLIEIILFVWSATGLSAAMFPTWLTASTALIPDWLPETALTTALLMVRPLAQDAVANHARLHLTRGSHKGKKN